MSLQVFLWVMPTVYNKTERHTVVNTVGPQRNTTLIDIEVHVGVKRFHTAVTWDYRTLHHSLLCNLDSILYMTLSSNDLNTVIDTVIYIHMALYQLFIHAESTCIVAVSNLILVIFFYTKGSNV